MWPAGAKPHIDLADPYAFAIFQRLLVGCRAYPRSAAAQMIASVSGVASAERWPGRAWSPWPCVITARGTATAGST